MPVYYQPMGDKDLMRFVTPALVALIGVEVFALQRRKASARNDEHLAFDDSQTPAETALSQQPLGYDRNDTVASLTICAASFIVPPLMSKVLAPTVPGRGKYGRVLVAGLVGAAAATTVTDALARSDNGKFSDVARRIRPSASVATAASGIVAGALTWASRTSARSLWGRGGWKRDFGTGIATHASALLVWDFLTYWDHRLRHTSRSLWAVHSVHHSSERYNLSTALRNPVAEPLMMFVPYGVMSWIGFRPSIVEAARAIDLTYQYWLHTELIDRLGTCEEFLNTPSHHRVHHGSQPEYLDRNHGGVLIIWDRLFGTFQREGQRVRYGLAGTQTTTNPLQIMTNEYRSIFRDVAKSKTWRERIRLVFGRPTSDTHHKLPDATDLELAS